MRERYVVYFMTAGTKPLQPRVVYCPHSPADDSRPRLADPAGPTSSLANEGLDVRPTAPTYLRQHIITSRGVHWALEMDVVTSQPTDIAHDDDALQYAV